MRLPSQEQALAIMRAGILAPSADNRHHIRFALSKNGLTIWADEAMLTFVHPHRTILTLIAVGAVIENVLVQASQYGFAGHVRCLPDWRASGLIAEIVWDSADASQDALAQAIPLRHTNRRFFHGPRLDQRQQTLLNDEVAKLGAAQLSWLEGDQRKAALRLVTMAETERFSRPALHQEMFSAIRFDVGWTDSCADGLPPGSLEVEPLLRGVFSALGDWKLMRSLSTVGMHRVLGLRAAFLPCRLAPHLGVISTTGGVDAAAIAAGRAFERLWLRATLLQLALQPMAASVVLPLHGDQPRSLSERVESTLKLGWENLIPHSTPMMLFRLGRAKPPTVTTSRKPISAYLRDDPAAAAT